MQCRPLGRTGIPVGVIGLGAEHLEQAPVETVVSVVHEALDHGVNYIDLFMGSPGVRDNFGIALAGRKEEVLIAGHLGATWDGQYVKSRDPRICEEFIDDLLRRTRLDCLGVLMLHFVDEAADYDRVFGPGGLLETALRLKERGKARCLGLSSHVVSVSRRAVESGYIDVLMFPVNPAFDRLAGDVYIDNLWKDETYQDQIASGRSHTERVELYRACARHGVGIVAMKPYAAGLILNPRNPAVALTPVQCLAYALAQPGVAVVVPGCRTPEQMRAALAYLEAGEAERDFSAVKDSSLWQLQGNCMYCNHCLPCPAGIDIAAVARLLDSSVDGLTDPLRRQYGELAVKASACTECGACRERCPFGVEAVERMRQARSRFEG